MQFFEEAIESPWAVRYKLVADEQPLIEDAMTELVRSKPFVQCIVHAVSPCSMSTYPQKLAISCGSDFVAYVGACWPEGPACDVRISAQVDRLGCCLVVTTGGTGPAVRDVTPEATEAVCQKMMPGFGEQMRMVSLKHVPTAILSRQTAGIRGRALILNLPGKPKAIREILDGVFAAVPYCVDLIGGPYIQTHAAVVNAFRPPNDRRDPK